VVAASAGLLSTAANATNVSATATIQDFSATMLSFSSADSYFINASIPGQDSFAIGTSPAAIDLSNGSSFALVTLHDDIFDMPYTNAGVLGAGSATSVLQWSMDWVATGTGTAQVLLDYLSSALITNYKNGDGAGVSSLINMMVDGTPLKSEVFNFFSNQAGNVGTFDTLSLLFPVVTGQRGSLTITLASQGYVNPVPLPAAGWLLVSGLLGLGGFVRRRVV
jgi:hypothetical protein